MPKSKIKGQGHKVT